MKNLIFALGLGSCLANDRDQQPLHIEPIAQIVVYRGAIDVPEPRAYVVRQLQKQRPDYLALDVPMVYASDATALDPVRMVHDYVNGDIKTGIFHRNAQLAEHIHGSNPFYEVGSLIDAAKESGTQTVLIGATGNNPETTMDMNLRAQVFVHAADATVIVYRQRDPERLEEGEVDMDYGATLERKLREEFPGRVMAFDVRLPADAVTDTSRYDRSAALHEELRKAVYDP